MPRLAVLADIHGNLPALEAVIADMEAFSPDQVIVAGDSVNWGPFSREVMERITTLGWSVIRGNHEYYVLDHGTPRAPAEWEAFQLPQWTRAQLGPRWLNHVACLPDSLHLRFVDALPIRVVHGTPDHHRRGIYAQTPPETIYEWLKDIAENTLITAHTHIALERYVKGWHIINPGTVGVPLDGNLSARYCLLDAVEEGWRVTFRRVEYDNSAILAACQTPAFQQEVGWEAPLLLEEFKRGWSYVYAFHKWRQEHHPHQAISLDLVHAFLQIEDPDPYRPVLHRRASAD